MKYIILYFLVFTTSVFSNSWDFTGIFEIYSSTKNYVYQANTNQINVSEMNSISICYVTEYPQQLDPNCYFYQVDPSVTSLTTNATNSTNITNATTVCYLADKEIHLSNNMCFWTTNPQSLDQAVQTYYDYFLPYLQSPMFWAVVGTTVVAAGFAYYYFHHSSLGLLGPRELAAVGSDFGRAVIQRGTSFTLDTFGRGQFGFKDPAARSVVPTESLGITVGNVPSRVEFALAQAATLLPQSEVLLPLRPKEPERHRELPEGAVVRRMSRPSAITAPHVFVEDEEQPHTPVVEAGGSEDTGGIVVELGGPRSATPRHHAEVLETDGSSDSGASDSGGSGPVHVIEYLDPDRETIAPSTIKPRRYWFGTPPPIPAGYVTHGGVQQFNPEDSHNQQKLIDAEAKAKKRR